MYIKIDDNHTIELIQYENHSEYWYKLYNNNNLVYKQRTALNIVKIILEVSELIKLNN